MKYGTVGAAAVVEEELPSPKLKKLLVNSFGGAGRAPETNMKSIKSHSCLASVAHAVIQAIGRTELEDGTRTGVRLKRLHAHCGVCTSPTVMLNPLLGMTWLWGWGRGHNSHAKT